MVMDSSYKSTLHSLSVSHLNLQPTRFVGAIALFIITFLCYKIGIHDKTYAGFKLVGKENGEWSNKAAKERWAKNSVGVVKKGLEEVYFQQTVANREEVC